MEPDNDDLEEFEVEHRSGDEPGTGVFRWRGKPGEEPFVSDDDVEKPEAVLVYEAETDRIRALTGFLSSFAPAVGEAKQPGTQADSGHADLNRSRDESLAAAFDEVKRLCSRRFGEGLVVK